MWFRRWNPYLVRRSATDKGLLILVNCCSDHLNLEGIQRADSLAVTGDEWHVTEEVAFVSDLSNKEPACACVRQQDKYPNFGSGPCPCSCVKTELSLETKLCLSFVVVS